MKKCRRREGGEKGRRRNSYETKGSLMLLAVETRISLIIMQRLGFSVSHLYARLWWHSDTLTHKGCQLLCQLL